MVTRRLVSKGYGVRVLDKEGQNTDRLASVLQKIDLQFGDFSNIGDLTHALEGITTVLHFIGTTIPQTSMNDIEYDVETNVLPTVQLLELLKEKKAARLIFSSSGGTVYGISETQRPLKESDPTEPISAYGISKLTVEKYIRLFSINYGLPSVILRFSNPFGPSQHPMRPQGAVGVFLQKAVRGEEIVIWGDGSVVRDYLFEEDLGDAVAAVVDKPKLMGTFNIGTGVGSSLKEVLGCIEQAYQLRCDVRFTPKRTFDVPYNVLDIARISSEVGWRPRYTLLSGLEQMKKSGQARS